MSNNYIDICSSFPSNLLKFVFDFFLSRLGVWVHSIIVANEHSPLSKFCSILLQKEHDLNKKEPVLLILLVRAKLDPFSSGWARVRLSFIYLDSILKNLYRFQLRFEIIIQIIENKIFKLLLLKLDVKQKLQIRKEHVHFTC